MDRRRLLVATGAGFFAALCQAGGLLALKPVLLAGAEPLAVTALRTGGGALLVSLIGLWPSMSLKTRPPLNRRVVGATIVPGLLGYFVAVTLQLYALRSLGTGVAMVLSSAAPVMVLPLLWACYGVRASAAAWCGAALTVLGMGIMVLR